MHLITTVIVETKQMLEQFYKICFNILWNLADKIFKAAKRYVYVKDTKAQVSYVCYIY